MLIIAAKLRLIMRIITDYMYIENHSFINSFYSVSDVFIVFFDFIRFLIKSYNLKNINHSFNAKNSNVNLWPLLKNDFYSSTIGNVLIH